jgi:hypothetical protein
MTGRRGRRHKQLLDYLKEKRRYWKLKDEALDRTLWRTRFGRGYGPVLRQTAEWMNIILMTAHMISDCITVQTYSKLPPVFVSVHHLPSKCFVSFYDVVVAFSFVWILNTGFKVLWMLGRIASLAKPSNFQEGLSFIPFLQWFYDTKRIDPN